MLVTGRDSKGTVKTERPLLSKRPPGLACLGIVPRMSFDLSA